MDSRSSSPAALNRPDTLTATLHNATIDKGERNEFIIARSYTNTIEYEKISDPTNVFEESRGHPLQGTGSPTLQEPLASPDDDDTSVPATISLILPHELVERIFLLLDTKSMLKCRLVNREFNAIIQSSTLVQYYLACKAAGVIDNPQSLLSYAERLEALKKREDAWRKLKPVFETTIKVNDLSSRLSELTAGNFFLSDKNGKDLYYYHLPSSPQHSPHWTRIPGHGHGQNWSGFLVDIGMAIYEHDLVVNVISSEVGNQAEMQEHSLDLVLLKFSTGEYHPLTCQSLIHVQRSRSVGPYISIRIVGDNLALVVYDEDGSKLFVFDWKTGHKRLQHKATEDAYKYSIPVFVSPELLLVPNRILFHFEVWLLSPSHHGNPKPPVQILSLRIPTISIIYTVFSIYCHGELSPFLHSVPYFPPRPFFPSSENSIITVNILLESLSGHRQSAYKLIVHRHALLDMIQKWASTSPSVLEQQGLPMWLTNKVTVHKVGDPDDVSVRLGAHSELVSTMPLPGFSPRTCDSPTLTSQFPPTSPISHTSDDSSSSSISSGSASSTSRYDILQVRWADWGPPISRWFHVSDPRAWESHQSTGQRCVFLDPDPHDKRKCMVAVADFNPHNVRRNADMMTHLRAGEGDDNGGNVTNVNNGEGKKEENEEKLDHEGQFSEEVYMGLKCVVSHMPGEYDFGGVLMDEERLLGLKLDRGDVTESIKVLYFG